ncbi:TPA: hypothetical protein LSG62_003234 [Serratia liquefaciens]|nr:hypothetical protein [Serratia liquefaciens]
MPEMNNLIQVPFRVDGWNSTPLLKDLNDAGFETQFTMRHFNTGGADFFDLALAVTPHAITALANIFIAFVKRGKKVRINFEGGELTNLEADNYSVNDVIKLLDAARSIKRVDVSND